MRYEVTLGDRVLAVEVGVRGTVVSVDDRAVTADLRETLAGRSWQVLLEGSSHDVTVLSPLGQDLLRLQVDGVEVRACVSDARAVYARTLAAGRSAAPFRVELRAPMPGLLKALHVREGDLVEEGAGVATLVAMKMENELRAPARARIARIAVAAGDKVEGGALLVVLGPVGAAEAGQG
ncbi:MAG: biotin/lipoyl-containing protein [Candidatus Limnocylindria bacterium]|nr:biotin/lipoyl-containing protein [Candidatus Limnocylindria bacterium]